MFAQVSSGHSKFALSDEQLEYLQPCFLRQRREGANCLGCFHISNIMEISIKVKLAGKVRTGRRELRMALHDITIAKTGRRMAVAPTICGTVMLLPFCLAYLSNQPARWKYCLRRYGIHLGP